MPQFIFLFLVVLFPSLSLAASFDCTRAATKMEKLICSDAQLSKSDEDLAATYSKVLIEAADPAAIKKQQREWLADVRKRCDEVVCIRNAYTLRITQLASIKTTTNRTTRVNVSNIEACRLLADSYNNLGSTSAPNSIVNPTSVETTPEELNRIFGKDSELWTAREYWSLDFDNDGILDHFTISVDGTMRVSTGYFLSGKKGSTIKEISDSENGNLDLSVLAVGNQYYVVSSVDQKLGKLWYVSKKHEFVPVCEFKVGKSAFGLDMGKDNPVCSKIQPDKIDYVNFNLKHSLNVPHEGRFLLKTPREGLAKVDIDNDGQPDNVVRVDFEHGAGRGCKTIYLAVTNENRTSIPDTKLNKLLLEKLGGEWCGPELNVFELDGKTYVDANGDDNSHTIYLIKADNAEKICEYQERSVIEAVDISNR